MNRNDQSRDAVAIRPIAARGLFPGPVVIARTDIDHRPKARRPPLVKIADRRSDSAECLEPVHL